MTNQLPKMTVEARESTTAHGVTPPHLSAGYLAIQMGEAIKLNHDAKVSGWTKETLDILKKYIPYFDDDAAANIASTIYIVTGFHGWGQVCEFVREDACSEFFNMALKYCISEGQPHKKDKGFIDGSGIGYLGAYIKRVKETLEQCFDAKYFYKVPRPLVYAKTRFDGLNLIHTANHIHPGHWSYPAGHGTKFLTAVEVLNDVFSLDENCYRTLLVTACVLAMGRSGNLIHYPMDNLAGGVLTTLKEFN